MQVMLAYRERSTQFGLRPHLWSVDSIYCTRYPAFSFRDALLVHMRGFLDGCPLAGLGARSGAERIPYACARATAFLSVASSYPPATDEEPQYTNFRFFGILTILITGPTA